MERRGIRLSRRVDFCSPPTSRTGSDGEGSASHTSRVTAHSREFPSDRDRVLLSAPTHTQPWLVTADSPPKYQQLGSICSGLSHCPQQQIKTEKKLPLQRQLLMALRFLNRSGWQCTAGIRSTSLLPSISSALNTWWDPASL